MERANWKGRVNGTLQRISTKLFSYYNSNFTKCQAIHRATRLSRFSRVLRRQVGDGILNGYSKFVRYIIEFTFIENWRRFFFVQEIKSWEKIIFLARFVLSIRTLTNCTLSPIFLSANKIEIWCSQQSKDSSYATVETFSSNFAHNGALIDESTVTLNPHHGFSLITVKLEVRTLFANIIPAWMRLFFRVFSLIDD